LLTSSIGANSFNVSVTMTSHSSQQLSNFDGFIATGFIPETNQLEDYSLKQMNHCCYH
jgi:hypothetical protein